jgi:hypothetical protein
MIPMCSTKTDTSARISAVCDWGYHDDCDGVECSCSCHAPATAVEPSAPAGSLRSYECANGFHVQCQESYCQCSCHTPAATSPYRWLCLAREAGKIIAGGSGCLFEIADTDSRGKPRTTLYALQPVYDRQRFAGWQVTKIAPDGTLLECYGVDVSFGHDPRSWVCDCADSCYRSQRDGTHVCRHRKAMVELLAQAGISPTTGQPVTLAA